MALLKLALTRTLPGVDEVPSYRPKMRQCSIPAIRIASNDDTVLHEVCNLPNFRVGRQNGLSVAVALPNMNLQLYLYESGKDEMDE